jgi:hypothetical protein
MFTALPFAPNDGRASCRASQVVGSTTAKAGTQAVRIPPKAGMFPVRSASSVIVSRGSRDFHSPQGCPALLTCTCLGRDDAFSRVGAAREPGAARGTDGSRQSRAASDPAPSWREPLDRGGGCTGHRDSARTHITAVSLDQCRLLFREHPRDADQALAQVAQAGVSRLRSGLRRPCAPRGG